MKPAVHILATVRKASLIDAALLVFRTLRTGFPTAPVSVWGNGLDSWSAPLVEHAARSCGCGFANLPGPGTVHDAWIENLIQEELEPFWILDTDVCLWESIEDWFPQCARSEGGVQMAGRFEPEFEEESTGTTHVERLRTALMYIEPGPLRAAMRTFMARIPAPWGHKGNFPFVQQQFIPAKGRRPLFYDTCAGLWQAGIGTPFTERQDLAFDHLHCGTYIDLIGPKLSTNLAATHAAVYREHTLAKGMLKEQMKYYERQAPRPGRRNNKVTK